MVIAIIDPIKFDLTDIILFVFSYINVFFMDFKSQTFEKILDFFIFKYTVM